MKRFRWALLLVLSLVEVAFPVSAATKRQDYVSRAQNQLTDVSNKFRHLEKTSSSFSQPRRTHFQQVMRGLRQKLRLAQNQLNTLKHAPLDQWEAQRSHVDASIVSLYKTLHYLLNHYATPT